MSSNQIKPRVVGIDDGRAYTKLYAGEGIQLKIRTSVMSGKGAGNIGFSNNSTMDVGIYESEGLAYTIGDTVEGEDTRFEEFDGSVINRVAIHHALIKAGFGGVDVSVWTGLPVNAFYFGGSINNEKIADKRSKIKLPVTNINGIATANIIENRVCSEALASWLDYVLTDEGTEKPGADMSNPYGVVDFGGRTLDTLWLNPPTTINYKRSGSEEIGVLNLFDLIETKICKKFKISNVSRNALENIVRTKKFKSFGEEHDVTDIYASSAEEIAAKIEREIQRRFGSASDLEKILFVGGGAAAIPMIADRYPNAVLIENPEFSNARGMYKYGMMIQSQS